MKLDEQQPDAGPAKERLDSWKEIASYLKREVRTVQRWEKSEGLPVRRHLHKKQGTVYAYKSELDAWWNRRGEQVPAAAGQDPEPAAAVSDAPVSVTHLAPETPVAIPSNTQWHWMPRLATVPEALAAVLLIGALGLLYVATTGDEEAPTLARIQAAQSVPEQQSPAQDSLPNDAAPLPSTEAAPRQIEQLQMQPQGQPPASSQTQPAQNENQNAKTGWLQSLADEIHRGGRKVIEDTATLWSDGVKAGHPLAAMVRWNRSSGRSNSILDSGGLDHGPQFSPDGRRIVFASDRSGSREIWVAGADGQNPVRLTSMGVHLTGTPRWSADGNWIVFDSYPDGNGDIYMVSPAGGAVRRITTAPSLEAVPSWSRDGRSVYFASDRTGQWQVFRKSVEGGDESQVTRRGGFAAFESYDGKFVYYARHDASGLWRVPVDGGDEVQVLDQLAAGLWGYWALAPNGVYFAHVTPAVGGRAARARIEFFSFASGKTSTVAEMDGWPVEWDPGLAISPSGQSILFARLREAP